MSMSCPNCGQNAVGPHPDDGRYLMCSACGFGERGEWPAPDEVDDREASAGQGDADSPSGYGGASSGHLPVHKKKQDDQAWKQMEDATKQNVGNAMGISGGLGGMAQQAIGLGNMGPTAAGPAGQEVKNVMSGRQQMKQVLGRGQGGGGLSQQKAVKALMKVAKIGAVLAAGWVVILLLVFATLGYFTTKLLEVPLLKPATEAVAKIACLGGHGSETACKIDDLLDAFDDSGAEDALRQVWDCSNLKPGESRESCDSGAIAQMEGVLAIPKEKRWMIEVYIRASAKYDVPWEVIAATHGANTNFGEDGNCLNENSDGGGQYDFNEATWNNYKVDAGEEFHEEADGCWSHKTEEREEKDSSGKKQKIVTHVKYRDEVDDDPGVIADEDSRDMVDATFTQARILAAKGAKGYLVWEYKGSPAGSCTPNKSVDGTLYKPPVISSGGTGGNGTLTGGGNNAYDDIIMAKAAKYHVPPAVVKGIIEQESNFNPEAGSGAGARGLMQFMPATFSGLGYPASQILDPDTNIDAGAKYIADQLNYFHGNLMLALAAYNAGAGNVGGGGSPPESKVPPFEETQNYARQVPARVLKYGGWGDKIHLDIRYVDADFEAAQQKILGRVEIPAGSLTWADQPQPQKGFGLNGTGADSTLVSSTGFQAADASAGTETVGGGGATQFNQVIGPLDGPEADHMDHVHIGGFDNSGPKDKNDPSIEWAIEQAKKYGLVVTSGDRQTKLTASGNISDHWIGQKDRWARDFGGDFDKMKEFNAEMRKYVKGGSGQIDASSASSSGGYGATIVEEAKVWVGTTKFVGESAKDKVSKAVKYRRGPNHSDCYVAVVNEWYKVLTGYAEGTGSGVTGGGIEQAATLQMGWSAGHETDYENHGAQNDMHYCAMGIRCDYGGPNPPRDINGYNALGMKRNVPPAGNGRWDCSSFAGYVLWIGGGVNIVKYGGWTGGIWESHKNVLEFESGTGTIPPGGFRQGDLIWFGISSHIEVVKSPTESWGWGSEPGKIHKINGMSVDGLGTITNWMRPKNIKDQSVTGDTGKKLDEATIAKTAKALRRIGVKQHPIAFDSKRRADMAAYAQAHYGINSADLDPKAIVLHFTATDSNPFSIFDPNVKNGGELPNVTSHFAVMQDGTIEQFLPLDTMGRHTIGLNHVSIGIEVVERTSADNIFTRARQRVALVKLVRTLKANLAISDENILGHGTANSHPLFLDKTGKKNDHTDWNQAQVDRLVKLL
jgi:hypothetical protein